MEVHLEQLIEQIKNDGVAAAETEAATIVDSAKAQAEKIVADAKAQAEKIIADAKAETERMTKSSEDAIAQAGRNLLISFRESIARELKAITAENVGAVYSSESLAKIIVSAVESFADNPDAESVAVMLNSNDLEKLEQSLLAALKQKLSGGITLKASDNFDGGFRIAVNDSGAYYDYSAEAVVEMLSNYLSPKVAKILKEA